MSDPIIGNTPEPSTRSAPRLSMKLTPLELQAVKVAALDFGLSVHRLCRNVLFARVRRSRAARALLANGATA